VKCFDISKKIYYNIFVNKEEKNFYEEKRTKKPCEENRSVRTSYLEK